MEKSRHYHHHYFAAHEIKSGEEKQEENGRRIKQKKGEKETGAQCGKKCLSKGQHGKQDHADVMLKSGSANASRMSHHHDAPLHSHFSHKPHTHAHTSEG